MLEVAIFLEGQNGLNWPRWQRMAEVVERLGFVGLYRSLRLLAFQTSIAVIRRAGSLG